MVEAAAAVAGLLFLLPVIILQVIRARRGRPLWAIALDIPLAIAVDLSAILLLARVVRLELAVLLVRLGWLVLLTAALARRWRQSTATRWRDRLALRWPRELGRQPLAAATMAALAGLWLSRIYSHSCQGFDRAWHIPLAASVRGQRLPFANVYGPGKALGYHFAGDVVAAATQTLSGLVLHSSHALSLAHDVVFATTAACIALLLWALGMRRAAPVALAALVPLTAGPMRLFIDKGQRHAGYNFINLFKLGFRPHVVLACLLMTGFCGAVLVRLEHRSDPPSLRYTASLMAVCTAVLAVTDEASVGVLGLAAGVTWLVAPRALGPRRRDGLLVLVALAAALGLGSLLFHGSLVAGVGQSFAWVPARAPGYYHRPLPWFSPEAYRTLEWDLLPLILAVLGGGVLWLLRRRAAHFASLVFITATLVFSVLMLMHFDIGERSTEAHRFMTAGLFVVPLGALGWLAHQTRRPRLALTTTVIALALGLSSISSLDWLWSVTAKGRHSKQCARPTRYMAHQALYAVSCRRAAGTRFGMATTAAYFDPRIAYLMAGCWPSYASGPPPAMVRSDRLDVPHQTKVEQWSIRIGLMRVGPKALADVEGTMVPAAEPLRLVCARRSPDRICRLARANGASCRPAGSAAQLCELPADRRAELLQRVRGSPAPHPTKPRRLRRDDRSRGRLFRKLREP